MKKYLDLTPAELRALCPLYVPPPTAEDVATWRATREPPTSFNADYDPETWVHIIVVRPGPHCTNPQGMAVCWHVERARPRDGVYEWQPDHPDDDFCDLATAADRLAALGYDPAALIVSMCYYRPDLVPENLRLPRLASTKKGQAPYL
ncbi:MAG TPA: hypothetical protein PKH77_25975 [Anaerolineae bacterium]|nr:hypothetical protein [Anaerolineae bacterium]